MKLSQGLLVLGIIVVAAGGLLFWAYSAASAPLPMACPPPTADGEIEVSSPYPEYRLPHPVKVSRIFWPMPPPVGFSATFRHIPSKQFYIHLSLRLEPRYPSYLHYQEWLHSAGQKLHVSFTFTRTGFASWRWLQDVQVEDIFRLMTVVKSRDQGRPTDYEIYTSGVQQLQAWLFRASVL